MYVKSYLVNSHVRCFK